MQILNFSGISFIDSRGELIAFNDFSLEKIKRMYQIDHSDTAIIRAWQGHRIENKWFYVIQGAFTIAWVKLDSFESPSSSLKASSVNVQSSDRKILHIPKGYANGIKALEPNSKLLIFSDLTLEEAKNDNFKFDHKNWFDWIGK